MPHINLMNSLSLFYNHSGRPHGSDIFQTPFIFLVNTMGGSGFKTFLNFMEQSCRSISIVTFLWLRGIFEHV